ncbi:GAF domain-containing protein [Mucilaginibacter daejeonensis]|uniref:GAF domain-containing protein n=1 Tax=Mucilaginibacter daejeonensis TaxID=398049 RepID=UPI001D172680|nr:GAF domain-containing protein [Mucilaginibacter daejeonensis]UEG52121.1 GAF domain-containing protein [Mucilaginibacter daejeonensis]
MPQNELARLQAVNRFLKLKISKEDELQEIVSMAAEICGTPSALISLIDQDTQHIPIKRSFNFKSTPRSQAFCNHVIEQNGVMVVPDAVIDRRFTNNPLVTGDPHIRFYAGTPLTTSDGLNLGSLCVIGQVPGQLDEIQQRMLQILAEQVIQLLEFDASLELLKEQFLIAKQEEMIMRSFFDSCSCAHLLLDRELKVIAYSKAMQDFISLHHHVDIDVGYDIMTLIDPADRDKVTTACVEALSGHTTHLERHLEFGERSYWWEVYIQPAFDLDGHIIGVSYNGNDISARMQQKQDAERQQRTLQEIAFVQSHELRRPVASIQGLLDIISMDHHDEFSETLTDMRQSIDLMDQRIRQIVGYTDMKS